MRELRTMLLKKLKLKYGPSFQSSKAENLSDKYEFACSPAV